MLLRQSVSSVAQQLLCACTTPVVHAVANCYTPTIIQTYDTPSLTNETSLINSKRGLATASPQDERDISVDLVNNEANHFALYLYVLNNIIPN